VASILEASGKLDSTAFGGSWFKALKAAQDDIMERKEVVDALKKAGFEGAYINDGSSGALNVFDPDLIYRLDK
jgi:hypothetical protein